MLEIKDIEKLAKLARIDLTEEEKQTYLKDMGAILNYVDQIKEVVTKVGQTLPQSFSSFNGVPNHSKNISEGSSEESPNDRESSLRLTEDLIAPKAFHIVGENRKAGDLRNVMREDIVTNEPGVNTEDIVREFPVKEGDYLRVKKIL